LLKEYGYEYTPEGEIKLEMNVENEKII